MCDMQAEIPNFIYAGQKALKIWGLGNSKIPEFEQFVRVQGAGLAVRRLSIPHVHAFLIRSPTTLQGVAGLAERLEQCTTSFGLHHVDLCHVNKPSSTLNSLAVGVDSVATLPNTAVQ